jgi:hypothetical protein
MENLGVLSQAKNNVSLVDLNLSIGKALAAVYWYSKCQYSKPLLYLPHFVLGRNSNGTNPNDPSTVPQADQMYGEATMSVPGVRMRLDVSIQYLRPYMPA